MKLKYKGLSQTQVRQKREAFGENVLTPPGREPVWKLYLEKFKDPVIKVLLAAAALSFIISCIENEFAETVGIIFAIFLATGIGFYFEYDAGKKFDLLNSVNEETAVKVIRDGAVKEIPRKEVVVDDIVLLENGEEVPADGLLLEAVSLQVNESNLTGEPVVDKTTDEAGFDPEATYPSNEVLRGTTVADGHAVMKVLRVGDATEIGKVARQAARDSGEETPLNKQLSGLAKLIGKIGFTVALATFVIFVSRDLYVFLKENAVSGWQQYMEIARIVLKYFMMAVTLIVVTVPEGLPMSVTLSLALNMRRMLATNNLVRKMHACETMGAVTVICTDKTGTLTQNRMRVYETFFPGALQWRGRNGFGADKGTPGGEPGADAGTNTGNSLPGNGMPVENNAERARLLIAEGIAVNTTAYAEETGGEMKGMGNPTEAALLIWLAGEGIDYREFRARVPVICQLPFSTERKYMATLVRTSGLDPAYCDFSGGVCGMNSGKNTSGTLPDVKILYVKGAPEIVLEKCAGIWTEEGPEKNPEKLKTCREEIEKQLAAYQAMAMRTLGFAYRTVGEDEPEDCRLLAGEGELIFLGIAAIADPVREDVPAAVAECRKAGIDIKIVTGDTPGTATEIARRIGLWKPEDSPRNRITGSDFAALDDEQALERVRELKVISRARPLDKQRLVQLLQQKGEVVAVTGDGTNDAPALNHAQVGLSMGTGTSVAKEASDITLLDDSFSSIGTAVMWGRSLYKNIQRFIVFQLTINFIAMFIVLAGPFLGSAIPLTVTQMLWVNLIMDTFAALALASIPPGKSVMEEKPRKNTDFIITRPMYRSILGTGAVFIVILLGLYMRLSRNGEMSTESLTVFFTVFVMLQFWNLFNARVFGTDRSAFRGLGKSYVMWLVGLVILAGQVLIVEFGGEVFRTVPLDFKTWAVIIVSTSFVLWTGEIFRGLRRILRQRSGLQRR